jgi:adenylate kinase family enzyme
MLRVSVVGTSGSGKTTFAASLARRLGARHIELDSIYHQPNWTPLPDDEFRSRVLGFVGDPSWVVDGNYSQVRDLIWNSADTVIVLAYPRRVVMSRVLKRTLGRVMGRRELWNGNREPWSNLFSLDPARNISLWAWTTYQKNMDRYLAAMSNPAWSRLEFHRFVRPGDAGRFLHALGPGPAQPS